MCGWPTGGQVVKRRVGMSGLVDQLFAGQLTSPRLWRHSLGGAADGRAREPTLEIGVPAWNPPTGASVLEDGEVYPAQPLGVGEPIDLGDLAVE